MDKLICWKLHIVLFVAILIVFNLDFWKYLYEICIYDVLLAEMYEESGPSASPDLMVGGGDSATVPFLKLVDRGKPKEF